jgi:hypothetical protein
VNFSRQFQVLSQLGKTWGRPTGHEFLALSLKNRGSFENPQLLNARDKRATPENLGARHALGGRSAVPSVAPVSRRGEARHDADRLRASAALGFAALSSGPISGERTRRTYLPG